MDAQVRRLVRQILEIAKRENLDSAVVMLALADVTAVTAATLDLHGPAESRCSLNDRIDSFVAHVRARYPQILAQLVVQRTKAS